MYSMQNIILFIFKINNSSIFYKNKTKIIDRSEFLTLSFVVRTFLTLPFVHSSILSFFHSKINTSFEKRSKTDIISFYFFINYISFWKKETKNDIYIIFYRNFNISFGKRNKRHRNIIFLENNITFLEKKITKKE